MIYKPWKQHIAMVLSSCILAIVAILYIHITQEGKLALTSSHILKIGLLALCLLGLLEMGQYAGKKIIFPMLSQGKIRLVYLIIGIVCFIIAISAYVGFSFVFDHVLMISGTRVLVIIATAVVSFCVLCLELRLWKIIIKSPEKGWCFMAGDITVAIVCTSLLFLSFVPVFTEKYIVDHPYSGYEQTFLNVKDRSGERSFFGQITSDITVNQTFLSKADSIWSITLFGATYARTNTCILDICLINDDDHEVIDTWTLNTGELRDNSYFDIKVKEPTKHRGLSGKRCRLEITSPDGSGGNAITLYYATVDQYGDGELTVNGEDKGGDLIIKISGVAKPENYDCVRIWLCICYAVLTHVLVYFSCKRFMDQKIGKAIGGENQIEK